MQKNKKTIGYCNISQSKGIEFFQKIFQTDSSKKVKNGRDYLPWISR